MSSVTIIISIIILLAILLCYAFINQTITHKRQQKARMLAGLLARSRNFKFMINGFPKDFLPKELTLLVQRSLLHICEQLTKLEPKNPTHKEDLLLISQQMIDTQSKPATATTQGSIESPQQSREAKACLEELYKFVFHLESNKDLTRPQADTYRAMIKHLVLQLTVDSYALHGRIARDKEKPQLAIHYFNLALNLMQKERTNGHFESRMTQIKEAIRAVKEQFQSGDDAAADVTQNSAASGKKAKDEWDQFSQDDNDWKKKQLYD